ncbi:MULTISPECIES: hypothetical protein [Paraburkholderia]|uniref:Uncharacterized protein n=1 Tax=Paraburkholderia dipogonis TaxID=1211383 RepID=A0A4Y8MGY9_9BURK|nr:MULTISPECIES: hypothetical protein [Paraburkholderia]TFE36699.1 hypothetical protein E2553_44360 [Paraburkholderia dipogonis]
METSFSPLRARLPVGSIKLDIVMAAGVRPELASQSPAPVGCLLCAARLGSEQPADQVAEARRQQIRRAGYFRHGVLGRDEYKPNVSQATQMNKLIIVNDTDPSVISAAMGLLPAQSCCVYHATSGLSEQTPVQASLRRTASDKIGSLIASGTSLENSEALSE